MADPAWGAVASVVLKSEVDKSGIRSFACVAQRQDFIASGVGACQVGD